MSTFPISPVWTRPGLVWPQPFDAIFFDVDGVLIRTINSFNAANVAVTEYITGTIYGLDWGKAEGHILVSEADIEAFKRSGGFNSDWDMCYVLVALSVARLREWKDTELAQRSTTAWSLLARQSREEGYGGRLWVEQTFPTTTLTDYAMLVDVFNEFYWGAEELRKRFFREPNYIFDAPGFVHNEEMLFAPDYFARLRAAGIKHMGIITGRVGPEVDIALEYFERYCGEKWWDVVVPATHIAKPDPRALQYAITETGARGGLYIGDTADDFDLVQRYKAGWKENDPQIVATVVVMEHEADVYRQRGADLLVSGVEDLLSVLPVRS
ncbi:MAG TPA: HAD family hydrolase [Dictyobacter sp.]|jgi:phosphoglycolate phosphatase-like HAD superfamily hydrolase|nr:HAD family hydrolase [Dictyobacter sp.]